MWTNIIIQDVHSVEGNLNICWVLYVIVKYFELLNYTLTRQMAEELQKIGIKDFD